MRLAAIAAELNRPISCVIEALGDPRRQHRTAAALIVLYVLLWWAYAIVAKSSQGIHFDMGEQFAWSMEPAFGYPKHPPFCAWAVALWFAVFPRADWAYYLLSITAIGAALWFIWLIVARVVESGEKRAVALVFLAFAPTFNILSLKYNPNSMLIPVWALASWLFLRSFERRTLVWGVAAGLAAAVTMLTKYWSFFLILGFIAAALADPRRARYFRSPAPWASALAGAALLAPNMVSLLHYNFEPISYASGAHSAPSYVESLLTIGRYINGVFYIAGGFLVLALAARPDAGTWRDMLWPPQGERRLMMNVTLVSLLAPIAFAFALKMEMDPLWTMPVWSMLPAIMLSSPRLTVSRRAAGLVLVAAYAVAVAALAAAPVAARMILNRGVDHSALYHQLVAGEVSQLWPQVSDRPLRYVTGADGLAWACSFYCPDRPHALPNFSFVQAPWIDRADMMRQGFVALCEAADRECVSGARELAGNGAALREHTVTLTRRGFGAASAPRPFLIFVSPPQRTQ